tara:strand:- start:2179 stop:2298 length:120 start_codon:yes stop_codon:yes gene_type:complete
MVSLVFEVWLKGKVESYASAEGIGKRKTAVETRNLAEGQ